MGKVSFFKKKGWKGILSKLVCEPRGLEDPVWCRNIKCSTATARIPKGSRKCREKNRVRVGCDTEKFPHIHSTNVFPRYGIAEKIFVITVAPQNDICPQGSTYPKNAVAMVSSNRIIPVPQVSFRVLGDPNIAPRAM